MIELGSKQYKVCPNDILFIDRRGDLEVNDLIECKRVLLLGSRDETVIGRPYVPNTSVVAAVEVSSSRTPFLPKVTTATLFSMDLGCPNHGFSPSLLIAFVARPPPCSLNSWRPRRLFSRRRGGTITAGTTASDTS